MAKITLEIVTTTGNDKKNTTSISYVNPEATNDKLKQFAQMLAALMNETYVGANKITKESVI